MHYMKFEFGPMSLILSKFSATERGIYISLLSEYLSTETPLPDDMEQLRQLCGAHGRGAAKSISSVLKAAFVLSPAGWTSPHGDAVLVHSTAHERSRDAATQRQRAYREKQRKFIVELAKHGVFADLGWKLPHLKKALDDVTCDVTQGISATSTDHSITLTTTSSLSSLTLRERAAGADAGAPEPERAPRASVQAVKAMRRAGLAAGHPDDPRLIAALDAGVSVPQLAAVAAEAASSEKGFAWAVQTALGRFLDSKKAQEGPQRARGAANGGAFRGWVHEDMLTRPSAIKAVDSYKLVEVPDADA